MTDQELLEAIQVEYRPDSPNRICPFCGKAFFASPEWGYGLGDKDYCSWKCVTAETKKRKAKRAQESEETMQPKPKYKPPTKVSAFEGHLDEIIGRMEAGETLSHIALMGFDRKAGALQQWLIKMIGQVEYDALAARSRRIRRKNTMEKAKAPETITNPHTVEEPPKKPSTAETWMAVGTLKTVLNVEELSDRGMQIAMAALAIIEEAMS